MGSGPSNSTSTQSSQPPAWLQGDLQQLGTMGSQAIQQPLQQYQGPLVAGFNPDQQQAFNTINNAQGMAQPYINSGAQYLQNAAKPLWNQDLPQLGQGAVQGMGQQGSGLIGKAANTNIAGAGQPGVGMATNAANTGIAGANAAANQQFNVQPYMSPYTQNVVNATQAQFNNQNAQQQQGVIGNAISSGAFGGDRAAIAQAETANQEQLAQAPVIAGLYNQGFQNAEQEFNNQQQLRTNTALQGGQLGAQVGQGIAGLGQSAAAQQGQLGLQGGQGLLNEFNQQQQTQLGANQANAWLNSQAGFGMANLGQEAQQSALSGAAAQLQTGGLQQQQAQQQLNIPYEQFLQQQAYPYQQMNWLAGIDEGLGGTAGGTASTTTPGPDETSQVLGGLASVAGIAALALKRGGSVTPHTREPHGDVRAQLGALLDPKSKKDAVFLSPENAAHGVPPLPAHVMRVARGEGVLFTTNAEKAAQFRATKPDDASLARLLGYPEHKQAALASGNAVVVQARDRSGHVVSEALASPHMLEATKRALKAHAPGGTIHVVSTIAAQQRRVQGHTEGRAEGGGVPDVDVNITGEPPIGERGNAPQPMYPPPQKSDSGSGGGGMSLSTIASLASLAGVAMKRGGVIPHYESGGGLGGGLGGGGLGGSVPNVDVNYMGEAPKGVHGNAPGASSPQGSSSAGGSSLGDASSIMGSLDTIYNSGSGGYAPVPLALDAPMMSTSSLDTIGGFVGPTPAPYRRGGLIPQHRASGGGASKFVTNTNSLAGPGGPQVSSALFDRPTGWDAGGGSPGWFQPLAQYKPPGTETQTKTTNNLPNAPDWANSSSKITGDQTNQLFKTMLGRSAGDYAGQVAGKQSVSDVYQGILTSPEYQGLLSSGKVPGETQSSQVTGYTYPHTTFQPFYQAGAAATPTVGGQSLDQYLSSLTGNLALKRGGVVPIRRRDDGGGLTPANDDDAPEPQPMRATGTTGVAPPQPDQPQSPNYQGAIDRFINSPDPQPYKAADTKALREGIEHPHVDPWMSVLAAGLGMLSGTSPHAGVNIGRGAMQGLQEYQRERQQAVQGAEKEFDAEEKAQQLLQEGTRFQSQQAAAKGEMAEKVAHDQREQQYQQGQLGEARFRDTNTARYQQGELAHQQALMDQGKFSLQPGMGSDENGNVVAGSYVFNGKTGETEFRPGNVLTDKTAPSGSSLSPQAIEDMAARVVAGDTHALQGLGIGKQGGQNRALVNNEVSKIMREQNLTPAEIAERQASFGPGVKAFVNSQEGRATRAFDVALPHIDVLRQTVAALDNGDMPAFNALANRVAYEFGSPAPTDFEGVKRIVGNEIMKAVIGGGGALGDRDEIANDLNSKNSPQELTSLMDRMTQLMVGQVGGLRQQYKGNTNLDDFDTRLLTPEARAVVAKYGPHAAPSLPDAARAHLQAGHVTTFGNGQKWTIDAQGNPQQVP